jgi:hypothetical protein
LKEPCKGDDAMCSAGGQEAPVTAAGKHSAAVSSFAVHACTTAATACMSGSSLQEVQATVDSTGEAASTTQALVSVVAAAVAGGVSSRSPSSRNVSSATGQAVGGTATATVPPPSGAA